MGARLLRGIPLRALVPNAITAAALCIGLTGVRFAIGGAFEKAVLAVILAGMLDGIDGRIARLLKAQTRFGAELDSLADSINFGVGPALIVYLWSLQHMPRFGWFAALAFAICCVLRLARYNARAGIIDEPKKLAGFLTGVPAPVGAGLAFLPMYLWIVTGGDTTGELSFLWAHADFRHPLLVGSWLILIAFLMISDMPTLSWGKLRPRRSIRLEVIAAAGLVFAGLIAEPWWTLVAICLAYLVLIPVGLIAYARFRRRAARAAAEQSGKA